MRGTCRPGRRNGAFVFHDFYSIFISHAERPWDSISTLEDVRQKSSSSIRAPAMVPASAASSANRRSASRCTRATPFTSSRFILSRAPDRRSATFCTHCAASWRRCLTLHGGKAPILYGNCQAGWAIALLAADCQGLVGPAVLNGSPLSYWAGESGVNPARVSGGLLGGRVARSPRGRSRQWPVRRRLAGAGLREPEAGGGLGQIRRPLRGHPCPGEALPRVRTLVERLLLLKPRGNPCGDREPVHRQSPGAGHGAHLRGLLRRPPAHPQPPRHLRVLWRQHHPAAPGARLDSRRLSRH